MELEPFKLERYFAKHEFTARYLLSASDCDGLPQSELLTMADPQTRKLWDNLTLGYTESSGHPLLREEIAGLYQGISSDDILISAPEEGIFIALNTLLKKGDHVICTVPAYQSLYEVAKGLGCDITYWKPNEGEGWRFYPKDLEESIRPNTKAIIVNFPHNPTGFLPNEDIFHQIVAIAKRQGVYLFSDEMYRYLEYDPGQRLPSACDIYDKAITLFGMSKTFGLAGLRIGWLVMKDKELYQRMAAFKDYTTISSSAPSEILALIGLRNREQIVQRHLDRIDRNLKLLDQFFAKHSDKFSWVRPKAGTICFPRIEGDIDSFEFCERVVKDAGIMLLPSTVFDYNNHHFRLGFGRENMPEALTALEDYLNNNLFRS